MPGWKRHGRDLSATLKLLTPEERVRVMVALALLRSKRVPPSCTADDLADAVTAALIRWRHDQAHDHQEGN